MVVALAVLVAQAVLAVVVAVVDSAVAVPVEEASVVASEVVPVVADSNQNVSRNQGFVSFCKNNSNFACRYVII